MSEPTTKEATILDLSVQLMVVANELQATLDKRFKRNPIDKESSAPESPQQDNVLDEINQNLRGALNHYHSLSVYINSEVLPKIS